MSATPKRRASKDWMEDLAFETIAEERTVHLFRNLADRPFYERCSEDEKTAIRERIEAAARRHCLPVEAFLSMDEADHLTVSMLDDGPFLKQFKTLYKWARAVEKTEPFAALPVYGYLSPDPSHVGTGIMCEFVVSLWGLYLTDTLNPSIRAIERLGFDIRPQIEVPEDDDNAPDVPGCRYVLSSVRDTGRAEEIVSRMDAVCAELSHQEENARERILRNRGDRTLVDFLSRSFAIGAAAQLVSRAEGLDLLLVLQFARDLGLVSFKADGMIDVIDGMVDRLLGEDPADDSPARRAERATVFRKIFKTLKRV